MSIVQSIILGIIQGITEFIPISSSGHLVVFRDVLEIDGIPVLYDVLLHVATLIVVCFVFRRRIAELFRSLYWAAAGKVPEGQAEMHRMNMRTIGMVIVATVFTGLVGLGVSELHPLIPLKFVYAMFLVTAAMLILGKVASPEGRDQYLSPKKSILFGISQGIATLPGISRSGMTISVALLSGADRKRAGEMSFLISIPAIIGALFLELLSADDLGSAVSAEAMIAGCIAALISGFLAIKLLLYLIRGGRLYLFSIYLIPLGLYGLLA